MLTAQGERPDERCQTVGAGRACCGGTAKFPLVGLIVAGYEQTETQRRMVFTLRLGRRFRIIEVAQKDEATETAPRSGLHRNVRMLPQFG